MAPKRLSPRNGASLHTSRCPKLVGAKKRTGLTCRPWLAIDPTFQTCFSRMTPGFFLIFGLRNLCNTTQALNPKHTQLHVLQRVLEWRHYNTWILQLKSHRLTHRVAASCLPFLFHYCGMHPGKETTNPGQGPRYVCETPSESKVSSIESSGWKTCWALCCACVSQEN